MGVAAERLPSSAWFPCLMLENCRLLGHMSTLSDRCVVGNRVF